MLARVIRLEADVKHSLAKPKTISEARRNKSKPINPIRARPVRVI
jgi:hypothetical protein